MTWQFLLLYTESYSGQIRLEGLSITLHVEGYSQLQFDCLRDRRVAVLGLRDSEATHRREGMCEISGRFVNVCENHDGSAANKIWGS